MDAEVLEDAVGVVGHAVGVVLVALQHGLHAVEGLVAEAQPGRLGVVVGPHVAVRVRPAVPRVERGLVVARADAGAVVRPDQLGGHVLAVALLGRRGRVVRQPGTVGHLVRVHPVDQVLPLRAQPAVEVEVGGDLDGDRGEQPHRGEVGDRVAHVPVGLVCVGVGHDALVVLQLEPVLVEAQHVAHVRVGRVLQVRGVVGVPVLQVHVVRGLGAGGVDVVDVVAADGAAGVAVPAHRLRHPQRVTDPVPGLRVRLQRSLVAAVEAVERRHQVGMVRCQEGVVDVALVPVPVAVAPLGVVLRRAEHPVDEVHRVVAEPTGGDHVGRQVVGVLQVVGVVGCRRTARTTCPRSCATSSCSW